MISYFYQTNSLVHCVLLDRLPPEEHSYYNVVHGYASHCCVPQSSDYSTTNNEKVACEEHFTKMEMLPITSLLIPLFSHISSCSVISRSSAFPHFTTGFTDADLVLYFFGSFPVRGQIECCVECLSTTGDVRFYIALYQLDGHLCVCHRMLNLAAVQATSGSTVIKVTTIRGILLR